MDIYEVLYQTKRREVPTESGRRKMEVLERNKVDKFTALEPYANPANSKHELYFQVLRIESRESEVTDGEGDNSRLVLQLVREFSDEGISTTPFIQHSGKIYKHISVEDLIDAADTCYESVVEGNALLAQLDTQELAIERMLERKRAREAKKPKPSETSADYSGSQEEANPLSELIGEEPQSKEAPVDGIGNFEDPFDVFKDKEYQP